MNAACKIVVFASASATLCSIASAQAWMYDDHSHREGNYHEGDFHHRSTYEGDVREAMARQERANGAATRDHAEGYKAYMSAEQQRLAIWYQAYEIRRLVEQDRQTDAQRKAEFHRQRMAEQSAAQQAAARTLLAEIQMGVYIWPAALRRPEFSSSLGVIESVLRQWNSAGNVDSYARNALATEASLLRRRVSGNSNIPFDNQTTAVRTLKLLQRVATLPLAPGTDAEIVASLR
jgi:hypothetical protein